jgi:hypothetical protein
LLAQYSRYLFNLQQSTVDIGVQQSTLLTAYEKGATATSAEMEKLRHENTVLHSSALSPSEQDRELQVSYHHLNEAEGAWNYTRMLLDIIREEVDIHTHGIIHLEHHMELQDVKLEESAETIANLEQQLLELQGQALLDPIDHEEIDALSGVDEDYVSLL